MKVTQRTTGQVKTGKHPLYQTWYDMHRRCYNSSRHNYKYYGGRGIKVCDRWHDLENFVEDMGMRPDGYEIDRIDVDGDYEPSNCKWVTHRHNSINRRAYNKSGLKGIYLRGSKYEASVRRYGKQKYLGLFNNKEDAIKAVKAYS